MLSHALAYSGEQYEQVFSESAKSCDHAAYVPRSSSHGAANVATKPTAVERTNSSAKDDL